MISNAKTTNYSEMISHKTVDVGISYNQIFIKNLHSAKINILDFIKCEISI